MESRLPFGHIGCEPNRRSHRSTARASALRTMCMNDQAIGPDLVTINVQTGRRQCKADKGHGEMALLRPDRLRNWSHSGFIHACTKSAPDPLRDPGRIHTRAIFSTTSFPKASGSSTSWARARSSRPASTSPPSDSTLVYPQCPSRPAPCGLSGMTCCTCSGGSARCHKPVRLIRAITARVRKPRGRPGRA